MKTNDHYYKVTFYRSPQESSVDFKTFFDFDDAIKFAKTIRSGDVIEIKKYEKIERQ